jgi:hypothetical protein
MAMFWTLAPGVGADVLGLLPQFLDERDPRPAREQFDANYIGGWWPVEGGVRALPDGSLKYPGDPVLRPIAETRLRDEVIRVFEASFVSITQPDGSFEVARMD